MNLSGKYLELLRRFKISPNFWVSDEYFDKACLVEKSDGDWVFVWDVDASLVVFPPIHVMKGVCPVDVDSDWAGKFWSDFCGYHPGLNYHSTFLDFEYIYDPKSFLDMKGKDWAVFRKNCRKFPNRHPDSVYLEPTSEHKNGILDLISDWFSNKELRELHEAEVMIKYAISGKNRRVLILNDTIYGINVWDENWKMINYRLCICRHEEFVSEYMRFLFYTDERIQRSGKLVNDGGVLDNVKLKAFKDKMNPVGVRVVNTWSREK